MIWCRGEGAEEGRRGGAAARISLTWQAVSAQALDGARQLYTYNTIPYYPTQTILYYTWQAVRPHASSMTPVSSLLSNLEIATSTEARSRLLSR